MLTDHHIGSVLRSGRDADIRFVWLPSATTKASSTDKAGASTYLQIVIGRVGHLCESQSDGVRAAHWRVGISTAHHLNTELLWDVWHAELSSARTGDAHVCSRVTILFCLIVILGLKPHLQLLAIPLSPAHDDEKTFGQVFTAFLGHRIVTRGARHGRRAGCVQSSWAVQNAYGTANLARPLKASPGARCLSGRLLARRLRTLSCVPGPHFAESCSLPSDSQYWPACSLKSQRATYSSRLSATLNDSKQEQLCSTTNTLQRT